MVVSVASGLTVPLRARADLIDKTVQTDSPLGHVAWVIDTQLSPAQNGHASANWQWDAAQRVASDGRTWVIQVRARHLQGPHTGEPATGGALLVFVPHLVPGQNGGGHFAQTAHAGSHFDKLTVGYTAISSNRSRVTITLEHPQGVRPGSGWRDWIRKEWIVVVVALTIVVLGGAAALVRRKAKGAQ